MLKLISMQDVMLYNNTAFKYDLFENYTIKIFIKVNSY